MNRLFALLATLTLAGCGVVVDSDRAISAMSAEGWTEVEVTNSHRISPHWMGGCSQEDDAAFEVAGKNPAGQSSNATVCCGAWPKGCTIRH